MKVVLQRSKEARVIVDGETVGEISEGLVLLVGIHEEDTEAEVSWMADKIVNLRIFEDEAGKMNRSLKDINGQILSVSQFTLYGDCSKGRRPNFMAAAQPDKALHLYETFNRELRQSDVIVETGVFGAMMDLQLSNW